MAVWNNLSIFYKIVQKEIKSILYSVIYKLYINYYNKLYINSIQFKILLISMNCGSYFVSRL